VRFFYFGNTVSWFTILMSLITTIAYGVTYWLITSQARPTYNEANELVSGGGDLNAKGLIEYQFDIIYITIIVQLLVAFISDWFWAIYAIIPIYAGVKIYNLVGSSSPGEVEENDNDRNRKVKKKFIR